MTQATEIAPGVFRINTPPSTDYEWQQRLRIAARDWSGVHVAADRRQPLNVWVQGRRGWWK